MVRRFGARAELILETEVYEPKAELKKVKWPDTAAPGSTHDVDIEAHTNVGARMMVHATLESPEGGSIEVHNEPFGWQTVRYGEWTTIWDSYASSCTWYKVIDKVRFPKLPGRYSLHLVAELPEYAVRAEIRLGVVVGVPDWLKVVLPDAIGAVLDLAAR